MKKRYNEYKQLDLPSINEEILKKWKSEDTFHKSVELREGAPNFTFYEGPPSANGMPGIHHVMARAIKDIFCRYKTLQGFQVKRKAGWDTHGLPVELQVEKELGITKEDIGSKITIEEYNAECRKAVMKYTDKWNDLTEKMGYWVDMNDPYITYEPKYMESVWWLLKQMYDKGLLYKGYTIQPYSPKAGTGLSSHELNQPGTYKDVTDTTVVAQFKTIKSGVLENISGDVYVLAWTTTPWTLPSNTALTVGPDIEYNLIETYNQYTFAPIKVIIAQSLIEKQFGKNYFVSENEDDFQHFLETDKKKIPYRVIKSFKGKELVGIKYEQLLPWATPHENAEKAFQIIDGDFVTTEDGTGIVHTAPTFGADDARVAKEHGVPPMLVLDKHGNPVPLVDLQGRFIESLPEGFGGKYVKNEYYEEGKAPEKSIDVEIAILLKTENKAFKVEKYVHNYPHCWRTDKPVLYYPLDSWFIKVTAVKDKMVALNKTINWKPKATGEGRFGNWLENANDWNLSRSRYWGIPLPIWRTEDKTEELAIGSVEELFISIEDSIQKGFMKKNPFEGFEPGNMSEENYQKIDLHKNVVDQIVLVSKSGKPMKRESDLIDVWFDSGAMPYAQWHYPFENKELIDSGEAFPADYIAEGVDQTRGWFYTLHAISTIIKESVAYKNVISNGLVLDKNGQKMSKRLGNAIDPFMAIDKYGSDALRWYMISNAQPWDNLKFDLDGVVEVQRKFFGTFFNTYNFYALYANVDQFVPESGNFIPFDKRSEFDQWVLKKLNAVILGVTTAMNDYEPTRAARIIQDFVNDDLSNWYVRLSRRRFWKGELNEDKLSAYHTLYECLNSISIMASPIAPFFMEKLYLDLNPGKSSVHFEQFPSFNPSTQGDLMMIESMTFAQKYSSLILSLRKKNNIRVRQPLQKVMIPVAHSSQQELIEKVVDLIKSETNIKEIAFISTESDFLKKKIKADFKKLGPKYGKLMKSIAEKIQQLNQEEIVTLERDGTYDVKIGEEQITISVEDVEITVEDIPGWLVAAENNLTVALDITLTEDLKQEGVARDIVNRLQNLRKDRDYELTDRILVKIKPVEGLNQAVQSNFNYICTEILAEKLELTEAIEESKAVEIELEDNLKTLVEVSLA